MFFPRVFSGDSTPSNRLNQAFARPRCGDQIWEPPKQGGVTTETGKKSGIGRSPVAGNRSGRLNPNRLNRAFTRPRCGGQIWTPPRFGGDTSETEKKKRYRPPPGGRKPQRPPGPASTPVNRLNRAFEGPRRDGQIWAPPKFDSDTSETGKKNGRLCLPPCVRICL
jgi:hypothetical protein